MSQMEVDNDIINKFEGVTSDSNEFNCKCTSLAKDIIANTTTIVQIVEDLGVYLVHVEHEKRAYGTNILSSVLENVPSDFLNSTQLHFISMFYSDRLKDSHQVIPAVLKGIFTLATQKHLPDGSCTSLLTALFHNVPCQAQQQVDRYIYYKILKTMLENRENELKLMNYDLVYGVISAMDGERDPKNLIYLFGWLPTFLKTVNLGHLSEEMFEVMACYFPVDFRVPMEESNNITRDALANSLAYCLCAVPEFGDYCIPLATEKLEATLRISKLDSLNLLYIGCGVFSEVIYTSACTETWPLIHKEVLNNSDPEIETLCLNTMTEMIKKISTNCKTDAYKTILSDITSTLKANLRPDVKLFTPTAKLILSAAKGSKVSFNFIAKDVMHLLINIYTITDTIDHKILLLNVIIEFFKIYVELYQNKDVIDMQELAAIPNICLQGGTDLDDKLRCASLEGFNSIAGCIPEGVRSNFYKLLVVYLTTPQEQNVQNAIQNCLKSFAVKYTSEIRDLIQNIKVNGSLECLQYYLKTICVISGEENFTDIVLSIIMNNFKLEYEKGCISLQILKDLLTHQDDNKYVQDCVCFKYNTIEIIKDWLLSRLDDHDTKNFENSLQNITEIFKLIIGYQSSSNQKEILNRNMEDVITIFKNDKNKTSLYLVAGLIFRLREDVFQDFSIISELLDLSLNSENASIQNVSVQLIGNIINKLKDDDNLIEHLKRIEDVCDNLLNNQDVNNIRRVNNVIAWITKALVMRGHKQSQIWTEKLLELVQRFEITAPSFQLVMDEKYDTLSSKSYCNIRLLYRQMFFMQVCTAIVEKYNDNNNNYLLAFGYIMKEVPKQVLSLYFTKIIRLIVLCLDKSDYPDVLTAVLGTIKSLIESKDEIARTYIPEFIHRLLKLTKFEKSMRVRILSIQCLDEYTTGFELYKLLPYKSDIILALGGCLDDKKRLVRKEAVETRLKWYLIDAPI